MNRLGWIDAPEVSRAQWRELAAFAAGVRQDGLTRVLLCGMGGSSLAPAVLAHAFGGAGRRAAFDILDSTDPGAVLDAERRAPLEHTLFVIASKSGTTVETLAAYHHFARRAPPRQFVAVTDPRSPLESLAKRTGFRAVFGHPPDVQTVTEFSADPLDLGAEFLRWEYATWALCEQLGVNAFDQPDVEAAKAFGREQAAPMPPTLSPAQLRGAARPGDYVAILAYLPPRPAVARALERVRAAWGGALGCVATSAFGPRYLHSTGQLHKGGPNTGLFLVVTADDAEDVEVPEMGRSFGALKRAQAVGDVRALLAKGRRVAHVHLSDPQELGRLARL